MRPDPVDLGSTEMPVSIRKLTRAVGPRTGRRRGGPGRGGDGERGAASAAPGSAPAPSAHAARRTCGLSGTGPHPQRDVCATGAAR